MSYKIKAAAVREKMEDEEERRTGYCDGSLVRAKVFSFGRSVPERAEPRGSEQRTRTRGKSVEWMGQAATHQWDAKARASALARQNIQTRNRNRRGRTGMAGERNEAENNQKKKERKGQ
jgi:hypothetical protein